jgi:hypothetical protein
MSQRELQKQLLLQRIAAHRTLTYLEIQSLRHSFSSLQQLSGLPADLGGLLGGLTPMIGAALHRGGAPRWLRYGLTVTLPVAIMVMGWTGRRH